MAYRIRELREKKKLTQEQLAQMSGVKPQNPHRKHQILS